MITSDSTSPQSSKQQASVWVIIPAYNEAKSVGKVVAAIPKKLVKEVIVVNNNSQDSTAEVAEAAGAVVVHEPRQGYGSACLAGIDYLKSRIDNEKKHIVVFLDADHSDYPEQMVSLVVPILKGDADIVIGSRAMGKKSADAMFPQQVFGNKLAAWLINLLYHVRITDLGPFRAISWKKLLAINMQDQDYGWTVEMQIKAIQQKLKMIEVPVDYRKRIGQSKIAGTLKGTMLAGYKIIYTIFKYKT